MFAYIQKIVWKVLYTTLMFTLGGIGLWEIFSCSIYFKRDCFKKTE